MRQPPLFCLLLLIGILPAAVLADDIPSITTTGDAIVYAAPDEASLAFSVTTFARQLDDARQANDQACRQALAAVRKLGIDDKFLQASQLAVQVRPADYRHPSQGIEGYDLDRTYTVRIMDLKLADAVVEAVLKNGATNVSNLEFRTSRIRQVRDRARLMAIDAAREKARMMAAELGVSLGQVFSIDEQNWQYVGGNTTMNNSQEATAALGEDQEPLLPGGQLEIHAQVTTRFRLDFQTPATRPSLPQ